MKRPALVLHLTAVAFLLQSAASAPTASPPASDALSKQASGIAPVLLISFDGFRASYLDAQPRESLPNLNAFWEGGVRASIVPRFVSKTFPNHYSLVTGLLEQNHGVVGGTREEGNNMWDPYVGAWFSMRSKESFWWDGGGSAFSSSGNQSRDVEPVWVTARRAGMASRVYFWPGSEAAIRGVRPTEYHPYDSGVSFEDRVDAVAKWLETAHGQASAGTGTGTGTGTGMGTDVAASFHALYFEEPDGQGHAHGPHSEEVKAAVRRADAALGRLREKSGDAVWNATNIVVVADHGMATISRDRVIHLGDEPCGVDFSNAAVTGSAIVAGLWGRSADGKNPAGTDEPGSSMNDAAAAALVRQINACHPNVTAWLREDVPERLGYKNNRRVAPVVVAADVGWTLCGHRAAPAPAPDHDPLDWAATNSACGERMCSQSASGTCGAHGYDSETTQMRAVFMARGPLFRKDGKALLKGG